MIKKIKFSINIIFLLFFLFVNSSLAQEAYDTLSDVEISNQIESYPVRIHFFHTRSCPHCKNEDKFLNKIEKEHDNLEVRKYLLDDRGLSEELFRRVIDKENLSGGVPVTVIGDWITVGFGGDEVTGREILNNIDKCREVACESWIDEFLGLPRIEKKSHKEPQSIVEEKKQEDELDTSLGELNKEKENSYQEERAIDDKNSIMLLGREIDLAGEKSIYFWGIILGLADGVNPCMFSVLLFLLTYLLAIGSKKKALKAGIVFLVTTFLVYFSFMAGLIKVIDIFEISLMARNFIIIMAGVFGVIMVKDFFFYGKGVSLEISSRFKPLIERLIKKGTVLSAFFLAILTSIVEIPCTSGIPLAYIVMLENDTNKMMALIWYNLFFVVPLGVIILAVLFSWKKVSQIEKARIKYRRWMRLIAGILLLFLSLALYRNWL